MYVLYQYTHILDSHITARNPIY